MLLNNKQIAETFDTYTLCDCVIDTPNRFYYLGYRSQNANSGGKCIMRVERLPDGSAEVRRNRLRGFDYPIFCNIEPTSGKLHVMDSLSQSFRSGQGVISRISSAGEPDKGPLRGVVTAVRSVGGRLLAVTNARDILISEDGVTWQHHGQPIQEEYPAYEGITDVGGYGLDNVYACCENGEMLHFDGDQWRVLSTVPKKSPIYKICCAPTGMIYLAAAQGQLFRGDGKHWEEIRSRQREELHTFSSLVWYNDTLWLGSKSSINYLDDTKLRWVDDEAARFCSDHLSVQNGTLLAAGANAAAFLEAGQWTAIYRTTDLQKRVG